MFVISKHFICVLGVYVLFLSTLKQRTNDDDTICYHNGKLKPSEHLENFTSVSVTHYARRRRITGMLTVQTKITCWPIYNHRVKKRTKLPHSWTRLNQNEEMFKCCKMYQMYSPYRISVEISRKNSKIIHQTYVENEDNKHVHLSFKIENFWWIPKKITIFFEWAFVKCIEWTRKASYGVMMWHNFFQFMCEYEFVLMCMIIISNASWFVL